MLLEGSCHCGAVKFSVESTTPYPYMRCYCSICRKRWWGGYAINIIGRCQDPGSGRGAAPAHLPGHALPDEQGEVKPSEARRHFCRECGSALCFRPALGVNVVYPSLGPRDIRHALPKPPEDTAANIMLEFAAPGSRAARPTRHSFSRFIPMKPSWIGTIVISCRSTTPAGDC